MQFIKKILDTQVDEEDINVFKGFNIQWAGMIKSSKDEVWQDYAFHKDLAWPNKENFNLFCGAVKSIKKARSCTINVLKHLTRTAKSSYNLPDVHQHTLLLSKTMQSPPEDQSMQNSKPQALWQLFNQDEEEPNSSLH